MIKETTSTKTDTSELIRLFFKGKGLYYPGTKEEDLDTSIEIFKRENKKWILQDRTEIVYATNNPEYEKCIELNYQFEEIFRFMLVVYKYKVDPDLEIISNISVAGKTHNSNTVVKEDKNSSKKKRKKDEKVVLGRAEFDLGLLIGASPADLILELEYGEETTGEVKLSFEKVEEIRNELEFKLKARNVKNTEWFSKSDPYIKIYKPSLAYEDEEDPNKIPEKCWIEIFVTEHVDNCLDPDFKPFSLTSMALCRGKLDIFLKFEIMNYNQNQKIGKKDKLISKGYLRLIDAIEFHSKKFEEEEGIFDIDTFDRKNKFAGRIIIEELNVSKFYSLIDFLKSKLNISVAFGIDFTGSNGKPDDARSYHYANTGINPYQKIIHLIGSTLKPYDFLKKIYAYGFGAKVDKYFEEVSHCFPLNLNNDKPYVRSLNKVKKKYLEILPLLKLLGPTNFGDVIKTCLDVIKEDQREILIWAAEEIPIKNNQEESKETLNESNLMNSLENKIKTKLKQEEIGNNTGVLGSSITSFENKKDLLSGNIESSLLENFKESENKNIDKRHTLHENREEVQKFNSIENRKKSAYFGLHRGISYIPPTATMQFLPKMPVSNLQKNINKKPYLKDLPPLNYQVITLITDGDICDPEAVLTQLIRANSLPVSLLVIGVGEEKMIKNEQIFTKEYLQSKCEGGVVRNFVKFLYWKEYAKIKEGSRQFLRDVFGDLPLQIVRFYKLRGIKPDIERN